LEPIDSPVSSPSWPPKPEAEEYKRGNPFLRFLVSIVLFGAAYYFLFTKDLKTIAWIMGIIFIHELGHYLAMKAYKYEDLSIFFIPLLGAMATGSKERISQKEKSVVLLAGPVPGIIVGIILFYTTQPGYDYFQLKLAYVFVILNLFNLLPIYPLDGGQLLNTVFIGGQEIISNIFLFLSIAVVGWYAIDYGQWLLLVVPYILIVRLTLQIRVNKIRNVLTEKQIDFHKPFGQLSDEEYWSIRDVVLENNPAYGKYGVPGQYEAAEKEINMINYIKLVLKVDPERDLSITGIIIIMAIWLSSVIVPLLIMKRIWNLF
jgi:hypothetical protein